MPDFCGCTGLPDTLQAAVSVNYANTFDLTWDAVSGTYKGTYIFCGNKTTDVTMYCAANDVIMLKGEAGDTGCCDFQKAAAQENCGPPFNAQWSFAVADLAGCCDLTFDIAVNA